jgi:hypothetical protein
MSRSAQFFKRLDNLLMEFSTSKNLFDRALPYVPRTLPQPAREVLANFWAFRAACAECGRRVE